MLDLQAIIDASPSLPNDVKAGIVAIVGRLAIEGSVGYDGCGVLLGSSRLAGHRGHVHHQGQQGVHVGRLAAANWITSVTPAASITLRWLS